LIDSPEQGGNFSSSAIEAETKENEDDLRAVNQFKFIKKIQQPNKGRVMGFELRGS